VTNLERSQAKARQLVKSGKFHGWSPIAFELRFEDGFEEAREYVGEQGRLCTTVGHHRQRELAGAKAKADQFLSSLRNSITAA
jgi:hypothetical protein